MDYTVFDCETDGLDSTKIHCLCYYTSHNKGYGVITDYEEMKKFFLSQKILIGHNIIRYDIPEIEKHLGIKINCRLIDTLGLSWYLYPDRKSHGLGEWAKEFSSEKIKVDNSEWKGLNEEELKIIKYYEKID